jgi:hypothetical protein
LATRIGSPRAAIQMAHRRAEESAANLEKGRRKHDSFLNVILRLADAQLELK